MPPDPARLRATVERLTELDRTSASDGERAAAEWIAGELRALGYAPRLEEEPAHGTYWVPLGLLCAAGALAALLRRRRARALLALLAAAGIADDVSAGPHLFRRLLPRRRTTNVIAHVGEDNAPRTIAFVAHHDAAHGGLVFHPAPSRALRRAFPRWFERQETQPRIMWTVIAGPLLVAIGAAANVRRLEKAGAALSLLHVASLSNIAVSRTVPGANDNAAAVAALLELARLLRVEHPPGVRVLLLATGAEESFMEGMRGFVARHRDALPPTTEFVALESIGSPQLLLLEGEGMLAMRDYDAALRDVLADAADRVGVPLRRGMRIGFATDALIAMRAGFPAATLASCDGDKLPSHYHRQSDLADAVDYSSVAAVTAICLAALIPRAARAPGRSPPRGS